MKSNKMDWTLILVLSSFGIVMGLLSIKGFTQKLEPYLWILFAIISILIISKNIPVNPFYHALVIGFCWGILNAIMQSLFFGSYILNNPQYQDNFNKITFIPPRYFVLITGSIIGLITGSMLGLLTILTKKLW